MSRHASGLNFENTYAFKIQADFPACFVLNAAQRANSSEAISSPHYLDEHVHPLRPDHVVIQVGIVDCAPRIFKRHERKILAFMKQIFLLRKLADQFIRTSSRHRLAITRKRGLTLVTAKAFQQHLQEFMAECLACNENCGFTFVNIPFPGKSFCDKNHNAASLIDQYNSILQNLAHQQGAAVVNLHSFTMSNPDAVLPDGYHINAKAHAFIHETLFTRLKSMGL